MASAKEHVYEFLLFYKISAVRQVRGRVRGIFSLFISRRLSVGDGSGLQGGQFGSSAVEIRASSD